LDELPVLSGLEKERALYDEEKFRKEKVISDLEWASWRQKLRRALW
jgi:soluble P-type ATPase